MSRKKPVKKMARKTRKTSPTGRVNRDDAEIERQRDLARQVVSRWETPPPRWVDDESRRALTEIFWTWAPPVITLVAVTLVWAVMVAIGGH